MKKLGLLAALLVVVVGRTASADFGICRLGPNPTHDDMCNYQECICYKDCDQTANTCMNLIGESCFWVCLLHPSLCGYCPLDLYTCADFGVACSESCITNKIQCLQY